MFGTLTRVMLHYGGVLVWALATEYKDFGYVDIEREENRVCKWSFTTDLRGLGFKDEDVNGLHYRESTKTLTDGLRLIHDEASLYEMLSCASRTGLVELYVEHSEDWLRANNKLVDMNITTGTSNFIQILYRVNDDDFYENCGEL
uniref:Uncharacterized protein n=1 Tax=Tanacetum cinerariifolium TaxID=118510 RepID=A0A6L2J963_TANCI|nr:hypothetical protein CTI12_AA156310 [Tanacetum cinerariifolium]